ncbi:unnamed protein product [Prunus armeniaca]
MSSLAVKDNWSGGGSWLQLSEYREEDNGLPLPRMLRNESGMVRILMICLLDRRSVLLNSPKRGRLMSSVQEPKPNEFRDRDMLRESKSGCRCGRSAHPSNHNDPCIESQVVKQGVDSSPPIPLEVWLAEAMKVLLQRQRVIQKWTSPALQGMHACLFYSRRIF